MEILPESTPDSTANQRLILSLVGDKWAVTICLRFNFSVTVFEISVDLY